MSEHAPIWQVQGFLFCYEALRALAGALAPSHATVIREQWNLPGDEFAAEWPASCKAHHLHNAI